MSLNCEACEVLPERRVSESDLRPKTTTSRRTYYPRSTRSLYTLLWNTVTAEPPCEEMNDNIQEPEPIFVNAVWSRR